MMSLMLSEVCTISLVFGSVFCGFVMKLVTASFYGLNGGSSSEDVIDVVLEWR